jgi:hypothetical protein
MTSEIPVSAQPAAGLLPPVRKSLVLAGQKRERCIQWAWIGAVSDVFEVVAHDKRTAIMGIALIGFNSFLYSLFFFDSWFLRG